MNWILLIIFTNGAVVQIPQDNVHLCRFAAAQLHTPETTNASGDATRRTGYDSYCIQTAGGNA